MARITLKTILEEIQKLEKRFDRGEELADARLGLIKAEFEGVKEQMGQISGDVRVIRDQTAQITEGQVELRSRVSRLEQVPNA